MAFPVFPKARFPTKRVLKENTSPIFLLKYLSFPTKRVLKAASTTNPVPWGEPP